MPKGKEAPNQDITKEENEANLAKANEKRLAENRKTVEKVDGLVHHDKDYLPKGEKPKADKPFALAATSKTSVKADPKEKSKK